MSEIKGTFTIVKIAPNGYEHHRAFDEIIIALKGSIDEMGYPVQVVENKFNMQGINIVLGAHLLDPRDLKNIPTNSILYNFELLYKGNRKFIKHEYLEALNTFHYWDYSQKNIEEMRKLFPDVKATHVEVGGYNYPPLEQVAEKDIDVLFYGSINPRRQSILSKLRAAGLKVENKFGIYGYERDKLIARSKVVINIHQHEVNVLETVRVSYLMSLGVPVVAECNEDTEVPNFMREGLYLVPYDELVDACVDLANNEHRRDTFSICASSAIMEVTYKEILERVLDNPDLYKEHEERETAVAARFNPEAVALDLGCGNTPRNPYQAKYFYGVDVVDTGNPDVKVADLAIEPIPFEDNSIDFITAFDFVEHIPRIIYIDGKKRQPFIELMNEIWRVLKPGGIFRAHTPAYPHKEAFVDPTHVNFITEDTVRYFCKDSGLDSFGKMYGFNGAFEPVALGWDETYKFHFVWELRAIK